MRLSISSECSGQLQRGLAGREMTWERSWLPWSTNPGARWVWRMGREVMRAVGHLKCPCTSCAPSPSSEAQDQRERITGIGPCPHPGCAGAGDHPALRGPRRSPSLGGVEPGAPAPASLHHEVRRALGAGDHQLLGFCLFRAMSGPRRDSAAWQGDVRGTPGILWAMQELRQPGSAALALLSLEGARLFFQTSGAKQLLPIIHVPTLDMGLGLARKGKCSAAPRPAVCLPSCTHIPASCCHRVKDVPGDGGSLREVLDQGLMLLGMRFGTNTVFRPAVALSALGCGGLGQFCSRSDFWGDKSIC